MQTEGITKRLKSPILYKRLAPYWCEVCMTLVKMISVEEAAMISRVSAEIIYQNIENRCLHFIRVSSGAYFVCLSSLSAKI
jgi:hypothetical protein